MLCKVEEGTTLCLMLSRAEEATIKIGMALMDVAVTMNTMGSTDAVGITMARQTHLFQRP
jgi:hypothetical protein